MGATASHDFSNERPGITDGKVTVAPWTKDDVTQAWALEESLSTDARRKRYACKGGYVTIADFKPWDCQIQRAVAFAVGASHTEYRESFLEVRRKELRRIRRDQTLAGVKQALLKATEPGSELASDRSDVQKVTDKDIVNRLSFSKWNVASVVEAILDEIHEKKALEELLAGIKTSIAKHSAGKDVPMPSKDEARALLFHAAFDAKVALAHFNAVLDVMTKIKATGGSVDYERAYGYYRNAQMESVDAAVALYTSEKQILDVIIEKLKFNLHEGKEELIDMKLVRTLLRRYDNNPDDTIMAYSKEKHHRDKAVLDLRARLPADKKNLSETKLREILSNNYWNVNAALESFTAADKEQQSEEKKEADSQGAPRRPTRAELMDMDWETRVQYEEQQREQELKERDTPLVPEDQPIEPNTEINKLISVYNGDITTLEVDCILNAANSSLLGGGGIDGAIHKAAGIKLLQECATLGGAKTGEVKITRGYNLPAKYVLHTVGPIGQNPEALTKCYTNALDLAKEHKLKTIALCAVSTGVYGYPLYAATHVAALAVRRWLDITPNRRSIDKIIFCTFLPNEHTAYMRVVPYYFPGPGQNTFTMRQHFASMRESYGDPKNDLDLQQQIDKLTVDNCDDYPEPLEFVSERLNEFKKSSSNSDCVIC